jgi:hypothetical protein
MSAEIVNLRQARKRETRRAAEQEAAAKRALHGRTKGEKHAERLAAERAQRDIDGKKIER